MITFLPAQQQSGGAVQPMKSSAMPAANFARTPNDAMASLAPLVAALLKAKQKNPAPFKLPSVAKGTAMSDAAGGNSVGATPVAADSQPAGSMDA